MTELETIQFFEILESVEKDLGHLSLYSKDSKRVRTAAEEACFKGNRYQYNNIMERIHYLCIKISQDLAAQESLLKDPRQYNTGEAVDRGDYT